MSIKKELAQFRNIVERSEKRLVKLVPDIYEDEDEAREEEELRHAFIHDDHFLESFEVKTMPVSTVKKLKISNDYIIDVYHDHAYDEQKELVQDKIDNWDEDKIVVMDGSIVVDGYHQVVAAILSNRAINYIDLDKGIIQERLEKSTLSLGFMGDIPQEGEVWELKSDSDVLAYVYSVNESTIGFKTSEMHTMESHDMIFKPISLFRFAFRKTENKF